MDDSRAPNKESGFTLIELLLVILITGILAVTVSLQMSPATNINLGAQAKQLMSDIRYTQSLAMSKGQRFYLVKQSANTYQIMNAAGSPIVLPLGGTVMILNAGISFGALTNLPNNLIAFDGRGIPYTTSTSPGTALASNASISLVSGGSTRTVVITPQTGRVILQ